MNEFLKIFIVFITFNNVDWTRGMKLKNDRNDIFSPDVKNLMLLKLDFHLSNIDENIQEVNRFLQLYLKDMSNKLSNLEDMNRNIQNKTIEQLQVTKDIQQKAVQVNEQLENINNKYDAGRNILDKQLQVTKRLISGVTSPNTVHINYKSVPSLACKVDEGERVLDDTCLSYQEEELSWFEAVNFCLAKGGQLYFPNVNDDSLDQKLHRIYPELDSKFVWIGARYKDHAFKTLNNVVIPMDHPRWVRGHPFTNTEMDNTEHNCLLLYFFRHSKHRLWLAQKYDGCNSKFSFLCSYQ